MNTKLWVKGYSYREALNWGLGFPGVTSLSFSILAVFVSEVLQFVNTSTDRVEKNPNSTLLLIFKVWWGSSFSLKAKIKILLYLRICLSPLLFYTKLCTTNSCVMKWVLFNFYPYPSLSSSLSPTNFFILGPTFQQHLQGFGGWVCAFSVLFSGVLAFYFLFS